MSDIEKARFILYLMSQQRFNLKGSREVFSFAESYKWLLAISKQMEIKKEEPKK